MRIQDKTAAQLREMIEELDEERTYDERETRRLGIALARLSSRSKVRQQQLKEINDELSKRGL